MFITVFTPTYNRKQFLLRLYQSLLQQNESDFEWLVIDDGSTDDTADLIYSLQSEKRILIRYITKEHGGKHTAFNVAMREAKGDFLICIDSDDRLADGAISAIRSSVSELGSKDIGFLGYKAILNRQMLCDSMSNDTIHRGLYDYRHTMRNGGEYSIIFQTELLRRYPFPEPEGEPYVTESIIYDRMEMDGYTLCPLHRVIELCEYQKDGLSCNAYDYIFRSPFAQVLYHGQRLDLVQTKKELIGHVLRYHAYNRMCGRKGDYRGKQLWLLRLTAPTAPFVELYFRLKWWKWNHNHQ